MKLTITGVILAVIATSGGLPPITASQSAEKEAARFSPVAAGETAPDFALRDHNGATVRLSSAVEGGPVVLVFYRGYW